jgi:hypothetical protein
MYILIAVFINLANPQQPAKLMHFSFESKEQCETGAAAGEAAMDPKSDIKVHSFCVASDDLLNLDRA